MLCQPPAERDDGQPLSEYEETIRKNVMWINEEFGDFIESVSTKIDELNTVAKTHKRNSTRPSPKAKRPRLSSSPENQYLRRSARNINTKIKNYKEEDSDDEDNQSKTRKRNGSLLIKFAWFKSNEHKVLDDEYYNTLTDDDFINITTVDVDHQWKKQQIYSVKRKSEVPRLAVSQITEDMLKNIIYTSNKILDKGEGTTCHQCRQKTRDQKSYCRYSNCTGARGMFCGYCLGNRYGEDVAEVLKNPKWACPPCRGYCNCSICRRKKGLQPTGQLSQFSSSKGFKSVRHMLKVTEGENTENIVDVELENQEEFESDQDNETLMTEDNNDLNVTETENEISDELLNPIKANDNINNGTKIEDAEVENEQDDKMGTSADKDDFNRIEINNIITEHVTDYDYNELDDEFSDDSTNNSVPYDYIKNSDFTKMSSSTIIDEIFKRLHPQCK